MMDIGHTLNKRFLSLSEAAASIQIDPLDLLSYGIEGEIQIGVLAYSGITPAPMPDSIMTQENEDGGPAFKITPDWIIMLMPKTLRAIAQEGKVLLGRGYRWSNDEWEPVRVSRENGITISDLVVPVGAMQEFKQQQKQTATQYETPVSPEGKETFQKQIAGLALVIYKQAQGGKFGGKSPNKSQIAKAVLATIDELPKDLHATLHLKGVGDGAIRQNIAKGLQYLGFTDED